MIKREIQIGQHTLSIETGQAGQAGRRRASSSAWATRWCWSRPAMRRSPREGIDFLPLTVDYREYTYASGRIPGGFFKREGKATEKETLTSRLHRPADPAALPRRLALRDAGHRLRALGRHRERLGRARHHRRLGGAGALGDAVREDHRRRARRPGRRPVRRQPDLRRSASRAASIWSSPAARTAS